MELKHTEVSSANLTKKRAFAAMGVLVAGVALSAFVFGNRKDGVAAGDTMPVKVAHAAPEGTGKFCNSAFTPSVERRVESELRRAVDAHSAELKGGSDERKIVSFTISLKQDGRLSVQDAWTIPESGLMNTEIIKITGPDLSGISLAAPPPGVMCSYSIPVNMHDS